MKLIGHYGGSRFLVYALCDPTTLEARYVGSSTRGLARPRSNTSPAGTTDGTLRAQWCRRLLNEGSRPVVRVIEEVADAASLGDAERRAICLLLEQGARLLNQRGRSAGREAASPVCNVCEDIQTFLQRANAHLIRSAMREFDVYERMREQEAQMLHSRFGGGRASNDE